MEPLNINPVSLANSRDQDNKTSESPFGNSFATRTQPYDLFQAANTLPDVTSRKESSFVHDRCELNKQGCYVSRLMVSLCHCLWVCLDKLDVEGDLNSRVYNKVKQMTKYVIQLDSSSYLLYYLIPALLKSCHAYRFGLLDGCKVINDTDAATHVTDTNMEIYFCLFQDHFWAQNENLTLDGSQGTI